MTERLDLAAIEAARERLAGLALRTPLLPFAGAEAEAELYLKLENLQPVGSFKIRGAANALALVPAEELRDGVWTTSAGNMGRALAWVAHRRGVACTVVVPDHAPAAKLDPMAALGATIVKVPFDRWWELMMEPGESGQAGHFVHPVCDLRVMAGNGTLGLELLEDLAELEAVVIPFGGGGLSVGVATALRARAPRVRIVAAEVETAAPLAPSLAAGRPCEVEYEASFVDGIGGKGILPQMWPLVSRLVDESIVVSLSEVASALRLLAEAHHVVAEGAGAAALAAGLSGRVGSGKVAVVVSGGNVDASVLAGVLRGEVP